MVTMLGFLIMFFAHTCQKIYTNTVNSITTHWVSLTLVILTTIIVLSLTPLDQLPPAPGSDKTHHFIAYTTLMFPTALRQPKHWLMLTCGFICLSGAIELIQPYVNRYGEWLDMLANLTGLCCGWLLATLVRQHRKYFIY